MKNESLRDFRKRNGTLEIRTGARDQVWTMIAQEIEKRAKERK